MLKYLLAKLAGTAMAIGGAFLVFRGSMVIGGSFLPARGSEGGN